MQQRLCFNAIARFEPEKRASNLQRTRLGRGRGQQARGRLIKQVQGMDSAVTNITPPRVFERRRDRSKVNLLLLRCRLVVPVAPAKRGTFTSTLRPPAMSSFLQRTITRSILSPLLSSSFLSRSLPVSTLFLTPPGLCHTRLFSSSPLSHVKREKKYKLKTNHAAAARWKALANHFKRRRQGKSHINVKKSPARLNSLGQDVLAAPYHRRHLKRLLPYA